MASKIMFQSGADLDVPVNDRDKRIVIVLPMEEINRANKTPKTLWVVTSNIRSRVMEIYNKDTITVGVSKDISSVEVVMESKNPIYAQYPNTALNIVEGIYRIVMGSLEECLKQ